MIPHNVDSNITMPHGTERDGLMQNPWRIVLDELGRFVAVANLGTQIENFGLRHCRIGRVTRRGIRG